MSLAVFSAVAGLYLAPGSLHPLLLAVAILCIAVAAGAAGAINNSYDADIDRVMADQTDLVEPVHVLKQVICIKG